MSQTDQLLQQLILQQQETNAILKQSGEQALAGPVTHDPVTGKKLQDWIQVIFNVNVPAGGNDVLVTQLISQGYHFLFYYATGTAYIGGAAGAPIDLQLRMRDNTSDKHLQHDANYINWENFIGTNPAAGVATPNVPYTLGGYRRYKAGSTISMEFNNANAAIQVVQVVLHGIELYVE